MRIRYRLLLCCVLSGKKMKEMTSQRQGNDAVLCSWFVQDHGTNVAVKVRRCVGNPTGKLGRRAYQVSKRIALLGGAIYSGRVGVGQCYSATVLQCYLRYLLAYVRYLTKHTQHQHQHQQQHQQYTTATAARFERKEEKKKRFRDPRPPPTPSAIPQASSRPVQPSPVHSKTLRPSSSYHRSSSIRTYITSSSPLLFRIPPASPPPSSPEPQPRPRPRASSDLNFSLVCPASHPLSCSLPSQPAPWPAGNEMTICISRRHTSPPNRHAQLSSPWEPHVPRLLYTTRYAPCPSHPAPCTVALFTACTKGTKSCQRSLLLTRYTAQVRPPLHEPRKRSVPFLLPMHSR